MKIISSILFISIMLNLLLFWKCSDQEHITQYFYACYDESKEHIYRLDKQIENLESRQSLIGKVSSLD